MKTTFIYGLVDPKDPLIQASVRYVGKVNDPKERCRGHVFQASVGTCPKDRWIMQILKGAQKPQVIILEECPMGVWEDREKISQANTGKVRSKETCERLRKASTGRRHSEATRKKIGLLKLGNTYMLGHVHSEEARMKMSKASIGRKVSKEVRERISRSSKEAWKKRKAALV